MSPVPVGNKTALDAVLAFEPRDWAQDYSGTWLSTLALLVTAVAIPATQRADPGYRTATAVGSLRVSILPSGNLTSLDGTSAPSNASAVVAQGSWGDVVCDGGLFVYSSEALVAAWAPPPTATSPVAGYTVTLSTSATNTTLYTIDVNATQAAQLASLPLPPSQSARMMLPALAADVPINVHVAVWVPELPLAASHNLPRTVSPLAWPLGGQGGCGCATAMAGDGCGDVAGAPQVLAPSGPVIST